MEEINLSIRGFPSLFRKKNEKMERKKKEGLTALDTLLDATSISKYSFLKHQGNTKFQFNRATHAVGGFTHSSVRKYINKLINFQRVFKQIVFFQY